MDAYKSLLINRMSVALLIDAEKGWKKQGKAKQKFYEILYYLGQFPFLQGNRVSDILVRNIELTCKFHIFSDSCSVFPIGHCPVCSRNKISSFRNSWRFADNFQIQPKLVLNQAFKPKVFPGILKNTYQLLNINEIEQRILNLRILIFLPRKWVCWF